MSFLILCKSNLSTLVLGGAKELCIWWIRLLNGDG
jgi:hypothetical protein